MSRYGSTAEEIFVAYEELKGRFGARMSEIPLGAVAIYTHTQKLRTGLQQIMAGSRNFPALDTSRSDLMALTEEASRVSEIPVTSWKPGTMKRYEGSPRLREVFSQYLFFRFHQYTAMLKFSRRLNVARAPSEGWIASEPEEEAHLWRCWPLKLEMAVL